MTDFDAYESDFIESLDEEYVGDKECIIGVCECCHNIMKSDGDRLTCDCGFTKIGNYDYGDKKNIYFDIIKGGKVRSINLVNNNETQLKENVIHLLTNYNEEYFKQYGNYVLTTEIIKTVANIYYHDIQTYYKSLSDEKKTFRIKQKNIILCSLIYHVARNLNYPRDRKDITDMFKMKKPNYSVGDEIITNLVEKGVVKLVLDVDNTIQLIEKRMMILGINCNYASLIYDILMKMKTLKVQMHKKSDTRIVGSIWSVIDHYKMGYNMQTFEKHMDRKHTSFKSFSDYIKNNPNHFNSIFARYD